MEDKICHIFHRGLTISIEQYLPHPEGATVALLVGNQKKETRLSFDYMKYEGAKYFSTQWLQFLRDCNVRAVHW